jgi:hypothetical protein
MPEQPRINKKDYHRAMAYESAGRRSMPCTVVGGDRFDAIRIGISENNRHVGERVTVKDRRHSVERVLEAKPEMSDRAIAELCRVSHPTVAKIRSEVSGGKITTSTVRIGRDRKVYPVPAPSDKPPISDVARKTDAADSRNATTSIPSAVLAVSNAPLPQDENAKKEAGFRRLYDLIGKVKREADELSFIAKGPHYRAFLERIDAGEDVLTVWKETEGL